MPNSMEHLENAQKKQYLDMVQTSTTRHKNALNNHTLNLTLSVHFPKYSNAQIFQETNNIRDKMKQNFACR